MRTNIESSKIRNCYGNISHYEGWSKGWLITPTGIVDILTDYKNLHVRFDIGYKGRHYIKTFNDITNVTDWSQKKLLSQARIFMEEVKAAKSV